MARHSNFCSSKTTSCSSRSSFYYAQLRSLTRLHYGTDFMEASPELVHKKMPWPYGLASSILHHVHYERRQIRNRDKVKDLAYGVVLYHILVRIFFYCWPSALTNHQKNVSILEACECIHQTFAGPLFWCILWLLTLSYIGNGRIVSRVFSLTYTALLSSICKWVMGVSRGTRQITDYPP